MRIGVPFALLAVIAFVARPVPLRAAAMSEDEKAVWQAEHDWLDAYVQADASRVEAMETKEYAETQPDGHVVGRREDVEEVRSGKLKLRHAAAHEQSLKLYGDTAVVTMRLSIDGTYDGGPLSNIFAATDVLVRQNGKWLAAAESLFTLAGSDHFATEPLWRDGGGWMERHERFVADAKREKDVELLFVGDSITDFWRNRGAAQWKQFYGRYRTANIGISGDRTEHVLWRLRNGEIDGLAPKAVVLMIGTNNLGVERDGLTPRGTPAEAADGVKAVVQELRQRLPGARILLLGVFPRAHLADNPLRAEVKAVNERIAALDDGDHIHYLDIGPKFLEADGTLAPAIMPDFLHPSPRGYEIWGTAISAPLTSLLAQ